MKQTKLVFIPDYEIEFKRLFDIVEQFLSNTKSKAALQALKNASNYYKEPVKLKEHPEFVKDISVLYGDLTNLGELRFEFLYKDKDIYYGLNDEKLKEKIYDCIPEEFSEEAENCWSFRPIGYDTKLTDIKPEQMQALEDCLKNAGITKFGLFEE